MLKVNEGNIVFFIVKIKYILTCTLAKKEGKINIHDHLTNRNNKLCGKERKQRKESSPWVARGIGFRTPVTELDFSKKEGRVARYRYWKTRLFSL